MDLTQNPNCYVSKIVAMSPSVREMFYDKSITFNAMQEAVNQAVRQARSTPARTRFLRYLYDECCTKFDIECLCSSAVSKGRNYQ